LQSKQEIFTWPTLLTEREKRSQATQGREAYLVRDLEPGTRLEGKKNGNF